MNIDIDHAVTNIYKKVNGSWVQLSNLDIAHIARLLMPDQCVSPLEINRARSVGIERVIFNAPATIVIWKDGSKTVVKCDKEDFDPEKGLAMAIAKKALGNKGSYYNVFKKWLPDISGEDVDGDKEQYEQLKPDPDISALNPEVVAYSAIKKAFNDFANNVNDFAKRFRKDKEGDNEAD